MVAITSLNTVYFLPVFVDSNILGIVNVAIIPRIARATKSSDSVNPFL